MLYLQKFSIKRTHRACWLKWISKEQSLITVVSCCFWPTLLQVSFTCCKKYLGVWITGDFTRKHNVSNILFPLCIYKVLKQITSRSLILFPCWDLSFSFSLFSSQSSSPGILPGLQIIKMHWNYCCFSL